MGSNQRHTVLDRGEDVCELVERTAAQRWAGVDL